MTLRVATPPMPDALALWADMPLKPMFARAAVLQLARSRVDGFYAGADLVAVAAYYPLPAERDGEDLREIAFAVAPGFVRHLVGFVHLAHFTRDAVVETAGLRVRAHVHADHRPGHRLAALVGLKPVGAHGAFVRYECEGSHDEVRRRHQITILGA